MSNSLIEIAGLRYTYEDGTEALKGIDLNVEKGEFIAMLGSNGSGKTTLIKHLNGLLKASSGSVQFDGRLVTCVEDQEIFSRIGIVFQDPNDQLFAATVYEDVAFGPTNMGLPIEQVRERVCQALEMVGMHDYAHKQIHALSHGQKKRICVAGILAMNSEVIILDEPTAGLDPMAVHTLMHLLKDLNKNKGITMIMATHAVDLVPLFMNRIAILSKGTLLRQGSPEEIFGDKQMIEKAKLHLPLVAELMHILKTRENLNLHHIPLTVGEARREIVRLLNIQELQEKVEPGQSKK